MDDTSPRCFAWNLPRRLHFLLRGHCKTSSRPGQRHYMTQIRIYEWNVKALRVHGTNGDVNPVKTQRRTRRGWGISAYVWVCVCLNLSNFHSWNRSRSRSPLMPRVQLSIFPMGHLPFLCGHHHHHHFKNSSLTFPFYFWSSAPCLLRHNLLSLYTNP